MAGLSLLQAVAGLALIGYASATSLLLVDSKDGAYFRTGAAAQLEKVSIAPLMSAAAGLLPGRDIDAELSEQLSGILRPSALRKPKAYVVVNVAGIGHESMSQLFSHRQHRAIELTGEGCSVSAVTNALSMVSSANPTIKLTVIDQAGLQNCKGNCVEQNLGAAGEVCKSKVAAGAGPLQGVLTFENGESLKLDQAEDKLFAVELASVYAGIKGELLAISKRAELKVEQEDVELVEISFMGLHALAKKYGSDSSVVEAAREAVLRVLQWAVNGLDEAYGGDVTYQVSLLEQLPREIESVGKLMSWKDRSRRQLLAAASFPPTDETAAAKKFSSKAAGYASFVLLLYFSLAATWCMCFMPFKADTMLFGSKKDQ